MSPNKRPGLCYRHKKDAQKAVKEIRKRGYYTANIVRGTGECAHKVIVKPILRK